MPSFRRSNRLLFRFMICSVIRFYALGFIKGVVFLLKSVTNINIFF